MSCLPYDQQDVLAAAPSLRAGRFPSRGRLCSASAAVPRVEAAPACSCGSAMALSQHLAGLCAVSAPLARVAAPRRSRAAPQRCSASKKPSSKASSAPEPSVPQPAQPSNLPARRSDTRVLRSQLAALSQDLMAYEPQSLPVDRCAAALAKSVGLQCRPPRRAAPRRRRAADAPRRNASQPLGAAHSRGVSRAVQHAFGPRNPACGQQVRFRGRLAAGLPRALAAARALTLPRTRGSLAAAARRCPQPAPRRVVCGQCLHPAVDGRRRVDRHREPARRCARRLAPAALRPRRPARQCGSRRRGPFVPVSLLQLSPPRSSRPAAPLLSPPAGTPAQAASTFTSFSCARTAT